MARKGENIFKRKDGRWEARYIHHYENGKAKYRYIYAPTYTEAKAKRLAALSQPEQLSLPAIKQFSTVEAVMRLWLADKKAVVKESTYTRYYRIVQKYLLPLMGNRIVSKLDSQFISGLTEKLLNNGGVNQKKLSPKTVTDILCVLKAIFKYGQENGYPVPSLKGLRYPPKSPQRITIVTEENRLILERQLVTSGDLTSLGVIFTLFTGVRIGELCGLRWADIDFETSAVTIRRTIERIADLDPATGTKTKVIISEPKTEHSMRIIPIPSFIVPYLQRQKKDGNCYLLTGTEKYTEPHQYYMRYKRFLAKHGLSDYTFHALRHTFATRCVELGFDTKSLSEILGHSDITTTLSIYVHPTLQQKRRQMEKLAPALV